MSSTTVPVNIDDPINAKILTVSEDAIQGFVRQPLEEISKQCGIDIQVIISRLRAMLQGGSIRRIRQTMIATSLAPGALIAWEIANDKLNAAFDYMFQHDPFSGHAVIRTTDPSTAGSSYRLWTTLKVPVGYSMKKHCEYMAQKVGATKFKILPAEKLFSLGVGHVRRRNLEPGSRIDGPATCINTEVIPLNDKQWQVMMTLKREFEPQELTPNLWAARAKEAGFEFDEFCQIAEEMDKKKIIGRFSTFLEHVKKHANGKTVTRYNALFHWAVPKGKEMAAGMEVGRHEVMTHAYWREGGDEFKNVNVMGVAHGLDKDWVLAHKAAIDQHLRDEGIEISYTNVFWGGRSEIKPSEISPIVYCKWCQTQGLNPDDLKA